MNIINIKLILLALVILFATSIETIPEDDLTSVGLGCRTDSECQALCPKDTWLLPPDHPDYCDGGY